MNKLLRFVVCASFALLVLPSFAVPPPQTINYQGYLTTNPGGTPITTPQVMTFRLYDAASSGNMLWSEAKNPVVFTNGNFNVVLGSPIPITLAFDKPYWLSVEINTDGEMPRQPLASSPYAFRALSLDGAATITGSQVTGAVLQGGNTLGTAMNVGTQDNNTFSILANNVAAFRVVPASTANLIGGSTANFITAGVAAAVVSGGGSNATTDPMTGSPCPGSCANRVTDFGGSVGGGIGNQAGNGGGVTTDAAYAIVGGGYSNTASSYYSSVGGGYSNTASNANSVVGGGGANNASGNSSTVGGGYSNEASGEYTNVGGGFANTASGNSSTVGGGSFNKASGNYSIVGGGNSNKASGAFSFAAGLYARTETADAVPVVHDGAFVWADSNSANFHSTAQNEFSARATGGFRFVTAIDGTGFPAAQVAISPAANISFGATTRQMLNLYDTKYGIGVQDFSLYFRSERDFQWFKLGTHANAINDPGAGGSWLMGLSSSGLSVNGAFVSASDRNAKENFASIDTRVVLEKVVALPLESWNYRNDEKKVRHLGPMAQDFYAAFGVGPDDKHIATVDADGVALAAIQGLNQLVGRKNAEIETQGKRIKALEDALAAIQARLGLR